jgi:hypothetical protein
MSVLDRTTAAQKLNALFGFWGGEQQCRQEGAEQSLAPASGVVHELKEGEIVRQLHLGDATVRSQPGAQEGPDALQGIDVGLTEAVVASFSSTPNS